ncbi:hypothetical protein P5487_017495 [Bacillus amyloliquefaciens]|nr:hypothetical protein [Bacillus amyloliquefaciens]MDH3088212.1 hypothetical protein [Bacillus amyloliquefaciens]
MREENQIKNETLGQRKRREIREKQRAREKSPEAIEKKKRLRQEELYSMNNVRQPLSKSSENTRKRFAQKGKYTTGTSKEQKKWEQKRKDKYNQRVWKGWREKEDDQAAPVTTYTIEELEKLKNDLRK